MTPSAVILVRHADPAAGGADPSLSPAGVHRAGILAKMLADAGITAIFTSELRRTKETAKPLAHLLNIVPVVIANNATAAANQIKAAGKRVLVVGHSNTVPEFIHALGGPRQRRDQPDRVRSVVRAEDAGTRRGLADFDALSGIRT